MNANCRHRARLRSPRPRCGTVALLPALLARGWPVIAAAPPEEPLQLHPPRAEIPPSFWEQSGGWVVAAGILLLALAGLAGWWLLRRRTPVGVSPDTQARQTLQPLQGRPEDGRLLSRVSQTLRHYFAAAFDLPPDELTTSEFCHSIEVAPKAQPDLSRQLGEFLRQCDERKFAPPTTTEPLHAVDRALELIDRGEARLAALRAAAAAAAAPENPHRS